MISVVPSTIPANALLTKYERNGAFTDCYSVALPMTVSHPSFVEAFYTTWLFKIERALIAILALKPSSDQDAADLASGHKGAFAAWRVEQRNECQLLLTDNTGITRSWLMTQNSQEIGGTVLYFGSALIPRRRNSFGEPAFGPLFRPLLRFHSAYSIALLRSAAKKVMRAHVPKNSAA